MGLNLGFVPILDKTEHVGEESGGPKTILVFTLKASLQKKNFKSACNNFLTFTFLEIHYFQIKT